MKVELNNNSIKCDLNYYDNNNNDVGINNNYFELTGAILYYPKFEWTTSYLTQQVFLCLIKTREAKDGITRKYDKRARWFLRRINLWKPSPEFIIYREDLSKRVYQELARLQKESPQTLDHVIRSSLEMLFECIEEKDESIFNCEYYLLSVKRYKLFKWRFDRADDKETDFDSKYDINYYCYANNGKYLEKGVLDLKTDNKNQDNIDDIDGGGVLN